LNDPLIALRAIHFIATMLAAGAVFFSALVAEPAFQTAGADGRGIASVRLRLTRTAWISLVAVAISGVAWLVLTAEEISDRPLAAVFSDGLIWTVLARTGFGQDWLARFVLAGLLAAAVLGGQTARQNDRHRIGTVAMAAALVGSLAWAGHAVGTPGVEGAIHLTADALHLIAAALWVGGLLPLALLLHAARGEQRKMPFAAAQRAVQRFSKLGVASVAAILASGIVNTWFLAGSIPALVGTDYGRLLLVKVGLFIVMLSIAAVNQLRLTPHLLEKGSAAANRLALRQLVRNSVIEAILGTVILAIVAVLGTIPPGLHEQPIWPFPIRVSPGVFGEPDFYVTVAFGAAWIAASIVLPRFRWPALAIGMVIYVLLLWRLPTDVAYPTTFYGSPTGFSAQSIAGGESLFAAHCASCHGQEARGDGPASASLNIKPADLTADHGYEHTDGDLFWWITHGIASGMPAFGDALDERARWNLIDFIRANADATRFRPLSAGTTAAFPAPDFSAGCPDGSTLSVDLLRPQIAHIVVAGPGSNEWLRQVADRDIADKLRTVVIASGPEAAQGTSLCVAREPETLKAFALYRGRGEAMEGTELLVDAAGNLRSMWRSDGVVAERDQMSLERRVQGLRAAARVRRPSGAQGHTHTH
jgi:putative copper export protein/mono/diheme cytochrome c family protein